MSTLESVDINTDYDYNLERSVSILKFNWDPPYQHHITLLDLNPMTVVQALLACAEKIADDQANGKI